MSKHPSLEKHRRDPLTVLRAMRVLLGDDYKYAHDFDKLIADCVAWHAPETHFVHATRFVEERFPQDPKMLNVREAAALSIFCERDLFKELRVLAPVSVERAPPSPFAARGTDAFDDGRDDGRDDDLDD